MEDFFINIPRYVELVFEDETLTVPEAMENLSQALDEAYATEDRLKTLLRETGLM